MIEIKEEKNWDFKFHPRRLCIPIGMACNVKCKYCMRLNGKVRESECGISPMMKAFLQQLDPATTEAIVINGGEPLLYIDKIKELFSYAPKEIHKCVMTNGLLLTQEFVDYLNSIDGELHFSHEGLGAKHLKGIDVLEDERIVGLLNQINTMRLYTIITACNPDVLANYEYIRSKIPGVKNLQYTPFPLFCFSGSEYLIEDFNFDVYARSLIELRERYPNEVYGSAYRDKHYRNNGLVILPDGSVASLVSLRRYGTVENSKEELYAKIHEYGEDQFCLSQNCPVREQCSMSYQFATPFTCEAQRIQIQALDYARRQNVFRL